MKKTLFLLLFTCYVLATKAQLTTTNTFFPKVGDVVINLTDSATSALSVGAAGINQTWNFAGLNHQTADTLIIVASNTTPASAAFPSANLAILNNGAQTVNYIKTTTTSVNAVGTTIDIPFITGGVNLNFSSPEILFESGMTYPFTHNFTSKVRQSFGLAGVPLPLPVPVDSGRITLTRKVYRTVDGWGNVTTPEGSFSCLRVRDSVSNTLLLETGIKVFGFMVWTTFDNTTDESVLYNFINDSSFSPILTLTMDTTSSTVISATYRKMICAKANGSAIFAKTCSNELYNFDGKSYNLPGRYFATYTNVNQCDSLVMLDLQVTPISSFVLKMSDSLMVDSNTTYQWLDCDNGKSPIFGANSRVFVPTISGNYAVAVTNGSCTDTSLCTSITITSGINSIANSEILSIYPNPAKSQLNIYQLSNDKIEVIEITDILGRVAKRLNTTQIDGDIMQIPIGQLQSGVYFIKAIDSKGRHYTQKFIKE